MQILHNVEQFIDIVDVPARLSPEVIDDEAVKIAEFLLKAV